MESLSKTIKRLSEKEYNDLLHAITGGNERSNAFIILQAARYRQMDDRKMMEALKVNPSTYYTQKSRLNQKVADVLAGKVENPISSLLMEVKRVPALLFTSSSVSAATSLKNLEKKLIEYELSNELIVVYKTLARLHQYEPEYEYYEQLYNKHVAFSLGMTKAEDLFYDFLKLSGNYRLSRSGEDLESVKLTRRKLNNIRELYSSHKLYIIAEMTRFYYITGRESKKEKIRDSELELEDLLNSFRETFTKYPMDIFYQNLKGLTPMMFFELYHKSGSHNRALPYFNKSLAVLEEFADKKALAFFIGRFTESVLELHAAGKIREEDLKRLIATLENRFDPAPNETYHYLTWKKMLAVQRFYSGDYPGAAKIMQDTRNEITLKNFLLADVECKLFQAVQYCAEGDFHLCAQLANSVKRQIRALPGYEHCDLFAKILLTVIRRGNNVKKKSKIEQLTDQFCKMNSGEKQVLPFLRIDTAFLKKITDKSIRLPAFLKN